MLLNHRYRIIKDLAEGSFGKTFLAEDTQMPSTRRCVIKQLKPVNDDRPGVVQLIQERFAREAAVIEGVGRGHSQIPDLLAYFQVDGQFYLVQEAVDGVPLSELTDLPWPEEKVSKLVKSALSAIAYIHSQNIIHRDIKPENIILRSADHLPCFIDFGAVKELMNATVSPAGSLTPAPAGSIVIGTLGFMSPEQAAGRPMFSSDLYSLAMTAIYLLTGLLPLEIPTDSLNGRLLWKQFAPDVSDRFAGILTRAIHNNPAIRFTNAAEMLEILTQSAGVVIPRAAQKVADPRAVRQLANEPTQIAKSSTQLNSAETVVAKSNAVMQPPVAARHPPLTASETTKVSTSASPQPASQYAAQQQSPTSAASSPQTVPIVTASPAAPVSAPPQKKYYSPSASSRPGGASSNANAGVFSSSLFKKLGLALGASGIVATLFFVVSNFSSGAATTFEASSSEQLEDAIASLEEQVNKQPDNANLNLQLAESYTYAGDLEEADKYIAAVLDNDSSNSDALYHQGRLYFHISDYKQAIDILEDVIEENDKHGPAMIMLGRAYQETGEYDQAEEQFEAALRTRGQKGEAHLNLSYLQNLKGDVRAALKSADKAAKFFRGDDMLRVYAQKGTLYFDLKDIEKAEENWQAAAELSPRNPEAYVIQSISKFFLGDSEGAIANIEKATDINPSFAEAYAMKSLIHLNQIELEPSIAAIEQAIDLDDNSVTVLKITADVTLAQSEPDPELSYTASTKALEINPNNPYVLNQRCSLLSIVRELDAAIEDCSRSLDVNPYGIEAYTLRGQTYIAMGNFERAEADFTRIIETNEEVGRPQDPEAYAQRAIARTGLEDIEGAETDLKAAFELNGQEPIDFKQLEKDLEGELGEQLKEGLEELNIDLEQLDNALEIEIEQNL